MRASCWTRGDVPAAGACALSSSISSPIFLAQVTTTTTTSTSSTQVHHFPIRGVQSLRSMQRTR